MTCCPGPRYYLAIRNDLTGIYLHRSPVKCTTATFNQNYNKKPSDAQLLKKNKQRAALPFVSMDQIYLDK
jgi:hypothetical protein